MGLFRKRREWDLRQSAPPEAEDIGVGLWNPTSTPEVVRVLHDQSRDLFYFDTGKNYTYGANTGGYGRSELATLYMTEKLSLAPGLLLAVSPTLAVEVAVIRNAHGATVLAEVDWQDGLEPLLADPAFHAQ